MISASLPGEALAQLGQLGHLYPPPTAGMAPEFLAPPPRPYARYPPRRRDAMPAPPAPTPPFPSYTPFLPPGYASYLYRARTLPQPQAAYPMRPRPTSGFVPPAPAPHSPPSSVAAPVPPQRQETPLSPERGAVGLAGACGAGAPYFCRGALIRLEDGSLRRVEEMRTEDFVMSADRSGDLALTQCTLLRLDERADKLALTLTYDRNRTQVELESTVEHPFFVYGRGWASCKPERTLARYGLNVQRLQVGDVCVSLVARKHQGHSGHTGPPGHAMLPGHAGHAGHGHPGPGGHPSLAPPGGPGAHVGHSHAGPAGPQGTSTLAPAPPQTHPENLSVKEDARKRRWSASDVFEDDRPPPKKR